MKSSKLLQLRRDLALERLALALHKGHGIVPHRGALLPLHLHLRLGGELQLDGAGIHLGCAQQLLHSLHFLALKGHHGARRSGSCLVVGRRRGRVRTEGRRFVLCVCDPQALGGAAPPPALADLLGLGRCRRSRGGRGRCQRKRGALLIRLVLSSGASPAPFAGILAGLVVVVLDLRFFGDNCDLLTHLYDQKSCFH